MSFANDSINNTANYDLSVNDGYALELGGSMSIVEEVNDVTGFNDALKLFSNDTDRFISIKLLDPLYYIKAAYDINSHISIHPGNDAGNDGIDGTNDDAWALARIEVNDEIINIDDTFYKLPTSSVNNVNITKITANDDSGLVNTYSLDFTISHAANGNITVTSEDWSGGNTSGTITEDINKAQNAYWAHFNDATDTVKGVSQNALGENDVDNLLAVLTENDVETYYATEQSTAKNLFHGQNGVTSWTIVIDAIDPIVNSNLTAYAHNQSATNNDVFTIGDKIVANTPYSYSLSITDNLNQTKTLVPSSDVYGVLEQIDLTEVA
jgi:hypothetical protein